MRTRKAIMKSAWTIAKHGAEQFGGKAVQYISEALKIAWAQYKKMRAAKGGDVMQVDAWFLEKEFGHKSMVAQINQSVLTIKKQTKKAVLIVAKAREAGLDIVNEFWAPKSVCI